MLQEYIFDDEQSLAAQLEKSEDHPPGLVFNYPPVGAWPNSDSTPMSANILWGGATRYSHNLYIHIPFCRQKCSFCYYNVRVVRGDEQEEAWRYLKCLEKEALAYRESFADKQIATVFIGGGTPSRLTEEQIEFLFEKVIGCFTLAEGVEISFEGAPDSMTLSKLKLGRELGVTRATMGVQSFDEETLSRTRRDNNQSAILTAYNAMLESGIPVVNIDLIAGVEYEDRAAMEGNMRVLKNMPIRPSQVTLFTLSVREGAIDMKTLYRLRQKTPAEVYENSLQLYSFAREELFDMGYWQYSKNLFPIGDNVFRYQDNLWGNNGYCLALGASGYSHSEKAVYLNAYNTKDYVKKIEAGENVVERFYPLSPGEQVRRHMVLAMKHAELDFDVFDSFYDDVEAEKTFANEFATLRAAGIVTDKATGRGIAYSSNGIASVDRYLRIFFSPRVNQDLRSNTYKSWSKGADAFRFVV